MRNFLCGLIVAASLVAAGAVAAPAGTATKDPCKVLTTAEISKAFDGATVSKGKKGLTTPVNAQCEYTVAAGSATPEGDVIVTMMTIGGQAAYDGLKTQSAAGYEVLTEIPKSIYNSKLSVVNTLKGKNLLGVQGLFRDASFKQVDVKTQLVALDKAGLKRI
ncbi:MAG: hypothetical protein ABW211_06825 [Acidimicrobiia bacterium]